MNCFCSNQIPPIYRGDDATITLVVIQPDGSKMNFNGKTIKFIVKKDKNKEDSSAIIYKEFSPTEDTEELVIFLTEEDTDKEPGSYWYGVRVIQGDYQTTDGEGKLEIKQGPFYGE